MDPVTNKNRVVSDQSSKKLLSDSTDADDFDARPVYLDELEAKPSVFTAVTKFFSDIFRSVAEGFRSAWSAIQHAFGSPDNTAIALRHIKEDVVVPASVQDQTTNTPIYLKTAAKDNTAPITENSVAAVVKTDDVPLVDPDEVSFSLYLKGYNDDQRNNRGTVCPQNFREGATRYARKLYDKEVERCAEYSDKPEQYFLAKDKQVELKAAAALLNKMTPHPEPLKFGQVKQVAGHSVEQFSNFMAWREWKTNGNLPQDGNIDLAAAIEYAKSYIGEHNSQEDLGNKDVQEVLKEAYILIAGYSQYETDITLAMILFSADQAKAALAKPKTEQNLSPPAPPPPRAGAVSASPPAPPPPRVKTMLFVPTTAETAQNNAHAASALASISSLSSEEVARGKQNFEKFVAVFIKASSSKGGFENLLNEKEFLSPACVAMANASFESYLYDPNVVLLGADLIKYQAAGYLVNAAQRLAVRKT